MASPGVVAAAIVAGCGWLFVLAIRSVRRARQERLEAERALGLERVPATAELAERVNRLYRATRLDTGGSPASWRLTNVAGKPLPEGALFLLDATTNSASRHRQSESATVLVASPLLDLPPFIIFPRADAPGALAGLANRVVDWAVGRWGEPVPFPEAPEFEQRYLVSSADGAAVRAFLNPDLLHRISASRALIISAAGDTFALSRLELARKPGPAWLEERVNTAISIFALFRAAAGAPR